MALRDLSVTEFCSTTASDSPAPGGGSVSAVCGALAVSLAEMVGNLTCGKKGYEDVEADMKTALAELSQIRVKLLEAIDRDAAGFDAVMAAFAMPKATDEEKAARKAAIQDALKVAADIPMEVAETAFSVLPYTSLMAKRGNSNARTDALMACMCARTATLGALLNVEINVQSIRDEAYASRMRERIAFLRSEAMQFEKALLESDFN